jgi:hypothetical protein
MSAALRSASGEALGAVGLPVPVPVLVLEGRGMLKLSKLAAVILPAEAEAPPPELGEFSRLLLLLLRPLAPLPSAVVVLGRVGDPPGLNNSFCCLRSGEPAAVTPTGNSENCGKGNPPAAAALADAALTSATRAGEGAADPTLAEKPFPEAAAAASFSLLASARRSTDPPIRGALLAAPAPAPAPEEAEDVGPL